MKKVAIVQSNYIPWKGYFDLMDRVDCFVLYDDMQYTRRDWRNRNKIKTRQGARWLSIPVEVKGKYFQKINETKVVDSNWSRQHWATISHSYAKAPYFNELKEVFEDFYYNVSSKYLSEINYALIKLIASILKIETQIVFSSEFSLVGDQTEKLLSICDQLGAQTYYSGPAARSYFSEKKALERGISTIWMDYSSYPTYEQLFPPFDHHVTILDLLFNVGPDVKHYWKSQG